MSFGTDYIVNKDNKRFSIKLADLGNKTILKVSMEFVIILYYFTRLDYRDNGLI